MVGVPASDCIAKAVMELRIHVFSTVTAQRSTCILLAFHIYDIWIEMDLLYPPHCTCSQVIAKEQTGKWARCTNICSRSHNLHISTLKQYSLQIN